MRGRQIAPANPELGRLVVTMMCAGPVEGLRVGSLTQPWNLSIVNMRHDTPAFVEASTTTPNAPTAGQVMSIWIFGVTTFEDRVHGNGPHTVVLASVTVDRIAVKAIAIPSSRPRRPYSPR